MMSEEKHPINQCHYGATVKTLEEKIEWQNRTIAAMTEELAEVKSLRATMQTAAELESERAEKAEAALAESQARVKELNAEVIYLIEIGYQGGRKGHAYKVMAESAIKALKIIRDMEVEISISPLAIVGRLKGPARTFFQSQEKP